MNGFQIMAVLVCILLTALDGFDVLAISFASPGIAAEWGINRAKLGVVLAMELFGMAAGSVALGNLADRLGRRPTILICLTLMTVGMGLAALVHSVNQLLVVRFFTGLGIGGMLASTNAMAAEFSNARYRSLAVILMAAGYPVGAIAGGSVSTLLLVQFDWRAVFVFGAACTGAFLLIVWAWLPESIEFLCNKRPRHALQRLNHTLARMGHAALAQLPPVTARSGKASFKALFSGDFRAITVLLIVAYFAQIMTFYYILKWIPKIVVDMGYAASTAGAVLVWANVGGATGAILLGLVASRWRLHRLLVAMLLLSCVAVSFFGAGHDTLGALSVVAAVTGFFTNAGVVGFYALMAGVFPSGIRASGTGVVIGLGRGGAALGPVLAGFLFSAGFNLQTVSIVMGAGAAVAAVSVMLLSPVMRRRARCDGSAQYG